MDKNIERIFKISKSLDIGVLGHIFLFTWIDEENVFGTHYFCAYFPKDDQYKATIDSLRGDVTEYLVVNPESGLHNILQDYVNNKDNYSLGDSEKRIFDSAEEAVFNVFEKIYKKGVIKREIENQ